LETESLIEHDPYPLYSCTIIFSPILWYKIELHRTRESKSYLVSNIGRRASYLWLKYYEIVLQTSIEIFSTMLVECYFFKDADKKYVKNLKKVGGLIITQSTFQGLKVPNSFNYPNWNTHYKIKP
jgi:hypothetical protein